MADDDDGYYASIDVVIFDEDDDVTPVYSPDDLAQLAERIAQLEAELGRRRQP